MKHRSLRRSTRFIITVLIIMFLGLSSCSSGGMFSKATETPTLTVTPLPTNTPTPLPTRTPTLTPTITLTPTPVPGSFFHPLGIGDTIELKIITQEIQSHFPNANMGTMECTLLEVKTGDEALQIAIGLNPFSIYTPLVEGQEYLAVRVREVQSTANRPNQTVSLWDWQDFTLRYSQSDIDIWPDDLNLVAEGYAPLEAEFWVVFRIRAGSKPYLYFSPFYLETEQLGIRDAGVYFKLLD